MHFSLMNYSRCHSPFNKKTTIMMSHDNISLHDVTKETVDLARCMVSLQLQLLNNLIKNPILTVKEPTLTYMERTHQYISICKAMK